MEIFLDLKGILVQGFLEPSLAQEQLIQNDLDLLICDVVLGDQNGVQFIQECTQNGFQKPVLIISGFVPNANEILTNWSFLQKPFTRAALVNSVQNLLAKKI